MLDLGRVVLFKNLERVCWGFPWDVSRIAGREWGGTPELRELREQLLKKLMPLADRASKIFHVEFERQIAEAGDNIDAVLLNTDRLQDLSSKADNLAGASRGFYGNARNNRRMMQWEDLKMKLILGGIVFVIFMWFTWGWWFGGDDDDQDAEPAA